MSKGDIQMHSFLFSQWGDSHTPLGLVCHWFHILEKKKGKASILFYKTIKVPSKSEMAVVVAKNVDMCIYNSFLWDLNILKH
jgi:hypothetical protein